jgi:hypothetical protein
MESGPSDSWAGRPWSGPCDAGELLLPASGRRTREVLLLCSRVMGVAATAGGLQILRLRTVELFGVGGKCLEPDGHAGRLEARRVERDDAHRVVAIGLEVFYGDGGFLG